MTWSMFRSVITREGWVVTRRRGPGVEAKSSFSYGTVTAYNCHWLFNDGPLAEDRYARAGNEQAWDQNREKLSLLSQARMLPHARG